MLNAYICKLTDQIVLNLMQCNYFCQKKCCWNRVNTFVEKIKNSPRHIKYCTGDKTSHHPLLLLAWLFTALQMAKCLTRELIAETKIILNPITGCWQETMSGTYSIIKLWVSVPEKNPVQLKKDLLWTWHKNNSLQQDGALSSMTLATVKGFINGS